MHRGSLPRRKPEPPERSGSATGSRKVERRAASTPTPSTAPSAAPRGRGRPKPKRSRIRQATPTLRPAEVYNLADVLPTWRPAPKDPKDDLRRADNVLLALGLKPNREVAETFYRSVFAERDRMHGIMEGPGEELTVAAIATEGLDDSHHHLNGVGVGTALPEDGAASPPPPLPPSKDASVGQPSPPASLPASPAAALPTAATSSAPASPSQTATDEQKEDEVASPTTRSPTPPGSVSSAAAEDDSVPKETEMEGVVVAAASVDVEVAAACKPEPEAIQTPLATSPTTSPSPAASPMASPSPAASPTASPAASPRASPTASPMKASEECSPSDAKPVESDSAIDIDNDKVLQEQKELSESDGVREDDLSPENKIDSPKHSIYDSNELNEKGDISKKVGVSVKVEEDSPSTCEEAPSLNGDQKDVSLENDTQDEEMAGGSSESETSVRDNISGESEEFRMDMELASTDVKAEVIEDHEKSTDSGIAPEHLLKMTAQKRGSGEDLSNGQAKKQCLPDIVCGDANALDLSGIKKKDNKEPKIVLKPQSLLLSKLQGTSEEDKPKKDVYRNDDLRARVGEPTLPTRSIRRRSSREEKETRTSYQRRSSESNSSRTLERDQVLREMRTRVRSSYKERERAAKEDNSLLRDLLEPERDTFISDFVEAATQSSGVTDLDRVSAALEADIRHLTVEINAKEAEWNDLIRKKKLKEELALRVQRRKHVLALTGDIEADLARRNSLEDEARLDTKRDSNLDARLDRRHDHYREVASKTGEELLAAALRLGSKNVEDYHHRSNSSSPLARVLLGAVSSAGSACRLSSSVSLSAIPTPTSTSSALSASLPSTSVHNKSISRVDKQASGASALRNQRPILPKPSTATSGGHVVSDSSLDGNGKGIIGEGRQGPIIDVQSIIADYRSQHPENVPRRGRRMKPSGMVSDSIMASARPGSSSGGGLLSMSLPALGSGSHVRTGSASSALHGGGPVDLSELGFVLSSGAGSDGPSRPSSTESSLSGAPSQINAEAGTGMSFKDVLVQFAKMTNAGEPNALSNQAALLVRPPPPPYPEVTLHPVVAQTPVPSPVPAANTPTTSLLHGILTKPSNQSSGVGSQSHAKPTTFSPTLARLLTAPERTSSSAHHANPASVLPHYQTSAPSSYGASGPVLLSDLLSGNSTKKARSELTITPVSATSGASNTSLSTVRVKGNDDVVVLDGEDGADMNGDDGDADTDSDERRLVIDEGDNGEIGGSLETNVRLDRSKNSVPHCQGCNERDAEFVCAGCQRQWYCSRDCQIAAWDEHSEQCFPASNEQ